MSFRGFNWTSLCSSRAPLSMLAAALVFLNPVTCLTERFDQTAQQCCASRRCHTSPSRNKPDCCKIRLLASGQAFLTVSKTIPRGPALSIHSITIPVFSAAPVLRTIPIPVPSPSEHSPPELFTLFCSFLI